MLIKCLNCLKLLYYSLHLLSGVTCCPGQTRTPTQERLNQIEMSLDQTVDPCEDFYGYACNNWAEHHPNTKYDEITGQVDYQMNIKMINIIESAYQYPHQVSHSCQSFVEKTRIYYKSCIREKGRNVTRYFDNIKPGHGLEWPLVEELQAHLRGAKAEWPAGQFDVFALLGQLQGYGLNNVLISQEIARTENNSLQIMLEMPYVTETDIIPKAALMVLLIGWGLPETTAGKYAKKIKITEDHWLELYQNHSDSYDNEPVNLNYEEVKRLYPPLADFLEHIIPQQIQDSDFVVIHNMDYFQFLLNKTWGPKESQNISNYIMLKFLIHLIQDTTNSFTKLDCIKDMRKKMDLSVNYLYYLHIYGSEASQYNDQMQRLTRKIFRYYVEILDENYLNLNVEQLDQLKQKLASLTINVGNLPPYANFTLIEEFYSDVPALELGNYYTNHLHLLRHRFLKSLLYPQNQTFFIATDNRVGSSSAPIYIPKQNMVILPAGFLQPPIYHSEYDPIFGWSMLGFLLAHEYTHAIDTTGLFYDNHGHMLSSDTGILEHLNFTASLDCMQTQEPTDTIDERLADLVGARIAYRAYIREYNWQLQPEFSKLPWKKLFFLNMAQFFCGRKDVQFIDHDADAVRLQQIVMNLDSFAEAFQCPLGTSKLNPKEKCRLY